jgi:hypothetical protein
MAYCQYSSLLPVGAGDPGFLFSFMLYLGMFGLAIYLWKRKSPIAFGLLWFFKVTLYFKSNKYAF